MASKVELPAHFQNWSDSSEPSVKTKPRPQQPQKPIYKRKWFISIAVAVIIAIVIAIVVPLAVLLPNKNKEDYHASVMLPLYIYPQDASTWAPLYNSLSAQPNLNFTVIINPSSGPGSSQYPDEQYAAALDKLATYPNVRKVGYVRTGYASRNLSDIVSELNTYAGWVTRSQAFAMDGIFFDESPHQFSQEAVDLMLSASQAVKRAAGFQGSKVVIRNPGVIPDARFDDANTDISVVFEQSYNEYQVQESQLSTLSKANRTQRCYMVHSLNAMDKGKLRDFVYELSKRAKYLFVTNNDEQYYEQFGSDWSDFTDTIRE